MKTLILIAMAAVLVGCASTNQQQRFDMWQAQSREHSAAMVGALESCESDACRMGVAFVLSQAAPRMPSREFHPAWNLAGQVLNAAVPLAGSYLIGGQWRRALRDVSAGYVDVAGQMAGMDRADYSTNIGGDSIGGDRYGDGDHIGGDYTGRDRAGRDNIGGDRTDNSGRIGSPGDDIGGDQRRDSGDCRDGGDCSAPEPPAP